MFCTQCGTQQFGQSGFCQACGTRLPAQRSGEAWSDESETRTQRRPGRRAQGGGPSPSAPRHAGRTLPVLGVLALVLAALVAVALTRPWEPSPRRAPIPTQPAASGSSDSPTTPPPVSISDVQARTGDGVVRIETTACQDGGVGSGFLIAADLVATVAHVVDGAISVVLRQGGSSTTGTVVGFDRKSDLALVRASEPLAGHVFSVAGTRPDVGTDVAALGYPVTGPISFNAGKIRGLDRTAQVGSTSLTGLVQTDLRLDPGDTGGPLVLADGVVVGLLQAELLGGDGTGHAVPLASAGAQLQAWQQAPAPVRFPSTCTAPVGPSVVTEVVTDRSGSPEGPGIAQAFTRYVNGINTSDYRAAYSVLSPASQRRASYAAFSSGTESSYIAQLEVVSVTRATSGRYTAEVRFTSLQDPARGGTGQSCSEWRMTYTMVQADAVWRVDAAKARAGSPAPC